MREVLRVVVVHVRVVVNWRLRWRLVMVLVVVFLLPPRLRVHRYCGRYMGRRSCRQMVVHHAGGLERGVRSAPVKGRPLLPTLSDDEARGWYAVEGRLCTSMLQRQ